MTSQLCRTYDMVLADHVRRNRQMAFVTGARQVGKTTTCRKLAPASAYLDWDDQDHRQLILKGPAEVAKAVGLDQLSSKPAVVVFDELHKYGRWKTFLKGLFDRFSDRGRFVVTGSSRLDIYRRGGDSLMGRYFPYRMHPLSVGELVRQSLTKQEIRPPKPLAKREFASLWEFGGFPEPFIKRDRRFSNRWLRLRQRQLVREDIRDLTRIQEIDQIEILVEILAEWSSTGLIYSRLSNEISVAVDTMRRWIATLCALHYGFLVRPWFRNVARSLRKEPKWYCTDWAMVDDLGKRGETFVACHLLKAVHAWQDLGVGNFELYYLRDTGKREVDLVVIRNRQPWFLVEVKLSDTALSPNLVHFQRQIGAEHAFQVVLETDYVQADCFRHPTPCVVPARTLLSQLV